MPECGSIRDGKTFPDFIDTLFQRIKSGVQAFVVKVEQISDDGKSKNPVMRFHVNQNLVRRMPHRGNDAQQEFHRILLFRCNPTLIAKPAGLKPLRAVAPLRR
jgi:hypothetical protein